MTKLTQANSAQIAFLKATFPTIDTLLNENQIETIAGNLTMIIANDGDRDYAVMDLLSLLNDSGNFTVERLIEVVVKINTFYLKQKQSDLIEKYGYTKLCIFSKDLDDPEFCYTVGLSLKTGYELIVKAATGSDNQAMVIDDYSQMALQGGDITQERNDLFTVTINGEKVGLRTKAVKVQPEEVRKEHICQTRNDIFETYQIYFADSHNVFPDEPGYDEGFKQPMFTRI